MARRGDGAGRGRGGRAGREGRRARGAGHTPSGGALTPERVLAALARRGRRLVTPAALAADLRVGRGASKALRRALRALESEGRVERIRGRFRARRAGDTLEGIYTRSGRGGTVVDDTGRRFRVGAVQGAASGDRVAILPWGDPGGDRADVLHVVEGERDHWVGILHRRASDPRGDRRPRRAGGRKDGDRGARRGGLAFATPYRDDGEWMLRVGAKDTGGAEDGDVVVLVPARSGGPARPDPKGSSSRRQAADATPWARVERVLGRPGDPDADVAAVVWRHRLPGDFPQEVIADAEARAGEDLAAETSRRVDLRDLPFVTIDPESARDHDDAVAVEDLPDGATRLHVAIADVSHYVHPGSALDREALRRGNSTYFPDRALPMLPPALSSDACSLRAGQDRLALVVEIVFDREGRPLRRGFYPAVVRSRAHLPYERAAAIMEGAEAHPSPEISAMLRRLHALAGRLARRRREAGALFLDLSEARVHFDAAGRAVELSRSVQGIAHAAVEESMLAANRAVAQALVQAHAPGVYRNHDAPSREDAEALERLLGRLGLYDGDGLTSGSLARAVRAAEGPVARVVHPLVLRAMRQARYGADCRGHFALATEAYLHFTSPIRRYPDLVVHRVLKALLEGAAPQLDAVQAARVAARCSYRERVSERAERELVDLKKCQVLAGHVGEEHEGYVSGVARHGLYVTFDRWPAEGMVHVSTLPEFVSLDEDELSLVAERSRRRHALGDRVRVQIVSVDPIRARVALEIRRVLEPSPLFARR